MTARQWWSRANYDNGVPAHVDAAQCLNFHLHELWAAERDARVAWNALGDFRRANPDARIDPVHLLAPFENARERAFSHLVLAQNAINGRGVFTKGLRECPAQSRS